MSSIYMVFESLLHFTWYIAVACFFLEKPIMHLISQYYLIANNKNKTLCTCGAWENFNAYVEEHNQKQFAHFQPSYSLLSNKLNSESSIPFFSGNNTSYNSFNTTLHSSTFNVIRTTQIEPSINTITSPTHSYLPYNSLNRNNYYY